MKIYSCRFIILKTGVNGMLGIGNNFSEFFRTDVKYKREPKYSRNDFKNFTYAFEKTDGQKTLSFGAVLKPAERKRFLAILKQGGEKAEKMLSIFSEKEKVIALYRYPAEGKSLSLKETAAKLSTTVNNVSSILSRAGEKFQKYMLLKSETDKTGLEPGEFEFAKTAGLEINKSTKQTIEKLFADNSVLNDKEQDVLKRLYGLFGQKKETLKKISKDRNCSVQKILNIRNKALSNIKNHLSTGLTSSEAKFAKAAGLEINSSTKERMENIFVDESILGEEEKDILKRFFGLFGQEKETLAKISKSFNSSVSDIFKSKEKALIKIKRIQRGIISQNLSASN